MNNGPFESTTFYDDSDVELNLIASRAMRAQWRHRRVGPKYAKFGRRVKYLGSHLNSWIEKNTIQTKESA